MGFYFMQGIGSNPEIVYVFVSRSEDLEVYKFITFTNKSSSKMKIIDLWNRLCIFTERLMTILKNMCQVKCFLSVNSTLRRGDVAGNKRTSETQ